jgi:predicted permease
MAQYFCQSQGASNSPLFSRTTASLMNIFFALLGKLIPLYIIIGLGFIAGKYLHVKKESIAPLAMYILSPMIVFNAALTTPISVSTLSFPVLIFVMACLICIVFFFLGGFVWHDTTRNILAFAAGDGNTGYFGIPVATVLFNTSLVNIYIFGILGLILFENSLGFFITARGHYTAKECILKIIKLPSLYTFCTGLLFNMMGLHLGSIYTDTVSNFQGAYIILGMMIIGLGLASVVNYKFDFKFIGLSFFAKFFVWPMLMILAIIINNTTLRIYDPHIYKVMILFSIVPLAVFTVVFATQLNAQPEKASLAVLLSTLFALFYIPLISIFILK